MGNKEIKSQLETTKTQNQPKMKEGWPMHKSEQRKLMKKLDRDFTNIDKPYSGAEIAEVLGIRRQAVSNTLKRGLGKFYMRLKRNNNTRPFDTLVHMSIGFCVQEVEMKKFYKLLPPPIRKEIREDAKNFKFE